MAEDIPETLQAAVLYFADLDRCRELLKTVKWPDGVVACPKCGACGDRIGEVTTRNLFRCKDCRAQFSHKVGTIFEDSPLGLDKWFVALWSIVNCKNGISSHELGRAIGVPQKTAWFMIQRLRAALEIDGFDKFDGPAEADTTYVGGKAKNMHAARRAKIIKGRGAVGKAIVHGILQRGDEHKASQVFAEVVSADDTERLMPAVRRHVRRGAKVYTDAALAYSDAGLTHFHEQIDHATTYANGAVHVNGIENFWSLLKRSLRGTYIAVAPFHLCRYVAEQAFRFNKRTLNDAGRFVAGLQGVVGKRLTYRVLTAQDDAGFMGIT